MATRYDPVKYKISLMQNWNTVAPGYHNNWASKCMGPFKSTAELVIAVDISPSNGVLDVACGTGAVSMEIARLLGPSGTLVGIDFSRGALNIARLSVPSGHFIEMDADSMGLCLAFDKILCQYALMFFPNPARVLRTLYELLKYDGKIALAVHGTPEGVPYFSTIMEPVLRHMPDVRPEGTPTVHRFGDVEDLEAVISSAGFCSISIKEFTLDYEAGTFEEYWSDYMSNTANSIRAMIETKGSGLVSLIKNEAERKAMQFARDGRLCFPWQVLIATARRA